MFSRSSVWWLAAVSLALTTLLVALAARTAQAAYPTKAIEVTVAFAPGGGADTTSRLIAKHLSADLGVPVNILNKPGGNQIPAVLSVLSARADGYTLLYDTAGCSSLHATLLDLPYKLEDRTYGPMMIDGPLALIISGKSPWKTLKDVAEAAKKDPASFSWGRLGGTSTTDFTQLQFLDAAAVEIQKTKAVAFDGAGPAMTAIAGGHVMFGANGASAVFSLMKSGHIKVLAVTSEKRLPSLPDVPTTREAGFPSVDLSTWFAFSGPKGLAKDVLDRLDRAAKKVVEDPTFAKEVEVIANQPRYMPPDKTREHVFKEVDKYKALAAKLQR